MLLLKKITLLPLIITVIISCFSLTAKVSAQTFIVQANKPAAIIQPTMWGIFFEDINLGADGGIYAELVKNRSFEFFKPFMGWTIQQKQFREGAVLIVNRKEENTANPRFVRITLNKNTKGDLGLTNEGFRGMGIKKDLRYDFSVMYRTGSRGIKMYVELVDSTGKALGGTKITANKTDTAWQKVTASFTADATEMKAKMNVWLEGDGIIDLDMISLFPSDTWKNRQGGMRADMVQKLADLQPGFIRFPGGCIVEGYDLSQRYQWKKTIGPVEDRQLMINRWNFEFAHRPTPDYFQTFGLGFYEYFQLAEDIGAEPLPILNCGMACQFNSAEVVPLNELDPYIQDALDLIEFANGDTTTTWGKIRAQLGHPAPFQLKMMGVGNENWGPQYVARLKAFASAIKAKYPDFKLVNSSGTDPEGDRFSYLDDTLRTMHADLIDEHYYRRPEWFFGNAARYDNYPRNNTKIFAGEYAAQSDKTVSVNNSNCWLTALSEAAFMTGLERNADVVSMASYAPLFAHADGWQWTPDLIWVNNLTSYGTPDYYVQKMYSTNKGNKVVPITRNGNVAEGKDSLYATASVDTASSEIIIKIVNAASKKLPGNIKVEGVKKLLLKGKLITMQSNDLLSVNSFNDPLHIAPKESEINIKGNNILLDVLPYSFTVIRAKMQ